jgi:hypothetical protein
MAIKGKTEKRSPVDSAETVPVGAPQEATHAETPAEALTMDAAQEPAAPEPAAPVALAAEIVDIVSTPLAVIEQAAESAAESFSASFDLDMSAWSKKSLELWSENANAFLAFAEQLGKAKSFEEAVDLQSRFASERFEAFVRQSQELMAAAKTLTSFAPAPFRDMRKAA